MHRGFLFTAALIGALSVILGAFGAHTLKQTLNESSLAVFETAVRYQFYHVFAIALAGIIHQAFPNKWVRAAGQLFVIGIVFFCGSLYLLTYAAASGTSLSWAGPLTPLGGLFLIAGWLSLAVGIRKNWL